MRRIKFIGAVGMAAMLAVLMLTGCKKEEATISGITISSSAETVKVGSTVTLSYTYEPSDAKPESAVWSSSDQIVASVDQNGVVTGLYEGTATITVKVNDKYTATCAVTVASNMTGITLSDHTLNLKVDSTKVLTVKVEPEGANILHQEWSVSKDDVVVLGPEGYITGYKEGTATVTVKINDQFTDSCKVTVEKNIPPMTGITISSEAETINVSSTVQLSYTVEPTGAKVESAVWSSSDASVATVDQSSGLVTAIGVGNAAITITVNGTFTKTCAVRVQESVLLPGKFTVNSSGKQVQFTKGNLWCNASASPVTYSFESAQNVTYATLGQSSYTASHVCHFFWTNLTDYQSGYASYMPYASNYSYSAQSPSDKFWCGVDDSMTIDGQSDLYALTGNGSDGEWDYLFIGRSNSANLYAKGVSVTTSAGTAANCIVIAPDECLNSYTFDKTKTSYTAEEWAAAEAGGLVCLPAAGSRDGSSMSYGGSECYYWSATPCSDQGSSYILAYNYLNEVSVGGGDRSCGFSVRLVYSEAPSAPVYPEAPGLACVKIGDVWWAPVNCGYDATNYPYGKLYQWGRKYGQPYENGTLSLTVMTKSDDTQANSGKFGKYNETDYNWFSGGVDNTLWNGSSKGASDPCPIGWRVPTIDEFSALTTNKSSWTQNTVEGVEQNGYWFSGSTAYSEGVSSVFLPAAGLRYCDEGSADFRGSCGYYWCSSAGNDYYAWRLTFSSSTAFTYYNYRAFGYSVRCVQE